MWLIFKGRITTYGFLYSLNLGPCNLCAMCGLGYESIDQLMVSYAIAQTVWYLVSTHTGVCLNFQDGFGFGGWLISNNYSLFIKSVIAAASWFLWKAWCDKIFRNIDANCYVIVCKAFAHVTKFYNPQQFFKCGWPFLIHLQWLEWCRRSEWSRFFISNSNYLILIAWSYSKMMAINTAIQTASTNGLHVWHLFVTNPEVSGVLNSNHLMSNWQPN